jgi:deoxyribose-phosphate aldolase
MTHIEYCCYDYDINETETTFNVETAIKHGLQNIFLLPYSINYIRSELFSVDSDIKFGCPIDFPYGLSDQKTRNYTVEHLAKSNKISFIDLMIPTKAITNRKYDKLREDIKTNLDICSKNNVQLRYVLEYRRYGHDVLAKVCQILKDLNIDTILPSSGMMLDDINDNIIACKFLQTKTNIKTICNGNIYRQQHVNNILHSNIYGFRINNLNALTLI